MPADFPEIVRPMPLLFRLVLLGVAALVAVLPLRELGPAIWPLHIASPFLMLMVSGALAGALAVGGYAILGEGQRWRFPPGAIVIERRLWRRAWETRLVAADLRAVEVLERTDNDGPDTWAVSLLLHDRHRFETQPFDTSGRAEAVRAQILAHLGMAEAAPRR